MSNAQPMTSDTTAELPAIRTHALWFADAAAELQLCAQAVAAEPSPERIAAAEVAMADAWARLGRLRGEAKR